MKHGRVVEPSSRKLIWAARALALATVIAASQARLAADDSPTVPTAVRESDKNIRKWFAGLSDTDPTVRETSRDRLLGLSRKDLPTLVEAVKGRVPLMPAE